MCVLFFFSIQYFIMANSLDVRARESAGERTRVVLYICIYIYIRQHVSINYPILHTQTLYYGPIQIHSILFYIYTVYTYRGNRERRAFIVSHMFSRVRYFIHSTIYKIYVCKWSEYVR